MAEARYAVLLLAYGAPLSLDEVEPYLLDVRGGRPTPRRIVEDLRARYAAIGGRSPLLDRTREQAEALATRLGNGIPVLVGMRHWHPYIKDVLAGAAGRGIGRVVAVAMAPHYSRMSIGAYQQNVNEARGPVEVAFVPQWFDHPRFLDAVAERVRTALQRFPHSVRDQVPIVFTAHSLPERILADGDPYPDQLRASVAGVMTRLGATNPHEFAFQSAGRSSEPWLGPDAEVVLERLAAGGAGYLLVCPIGFVADHLEVLYDVDIEFQGRARKHGARLERTDSLNADPMLIEALADLVTTTAGERGWLP
ncbi:MAG TPA: ferrochelatase [Gemmatimonadales bacterium]|nr:ferrochelatase [Gemmatimonadales bacterium]